MSIQLSIDLNKVDNNYIVEGKKGGKYLALALKKNRNGKDDYGNDGMVVQTIPKALRQEGLRGAILGNYRQYEDYQPTERPPERATAFQNREKPTPNNAPDDDDSLPF